MGIPQSFPRCKIDFAIHEISEENPENVSLEGNCEQLFKYLNMWRFDQMRTKGNLTIEYNVKEINRISFDGYMSLLLFRTLVGDGPVN